MAAFHLCQSPRKRGWLPMKGWVHSQRQQSSGQQAGVAPTILLLPQEDLKSLLSSTTFCHFLPPPILGHTLALGWSWLTLVSHQHERDGTAHRADVLSHQGKSFLDLGGNETASNRRIQIQRNYGSSSSWRKGGPQDRWYFHYS